MVESGIALDEGREDEFAVEGGVSELGLPASDCARSKLLVSNIKVAISKERGMVDYCKSE